MKILKYILLSVILSSCIHIGSTSLSISEPAALPKPKPEFKVSLDYWDAIKHLNFSYIADKELSEEQNLFAYGLEEIINGHFQKAQGVLKYLFENSRDTLVRNEAAGILQGLYFLDFNWDALIALDSLKESGLDDRNTISMAKAWKNAPEEVITYSDSAVILDSPLSISGVPTIEVMINGKKHVFWIDTGAEFTVLSSDIAKECSVDKLTEESTQFGTSTENIVHAWPGIIEEMKLSDISFKNHPVIIIDKEDLEFKLFKIIRFLKIDGIVGWNAIQNLKLEIDYKNKVTKISKPKKRDITNRNFHFISAPFVSVFTPEGVPLSFFMDTGANISEFYRSTMAYVDTSSAQGVTAFVGGAGGAQKVEKLRLKNQRLILGDVQIDFTVINVGKRLGDTDEGFIRYDGLLGSNIAKNALLILDFQNGRCELKHLQE